MMKNVSIIVAAASYSIALWGCSSSDKVVDQVKSCMETATKGYEAKDADCKAVTEAYAQCLKKVATDNKDAFKNGEQTAETVSDEWIAGKSELTETKKKMDEAAATCAKNAKTSELEVDAQQSIVKTDAHVQHVDAHVEPTSLAELEVHQQKLGGKHGHKHTHAHVTVDSAAQSPADGHARQIPEPKVQ